MRLPLLHLTTLLPCLGLAACVAAAEPLVLDPQDVERIVRVAPLPVPRTPAWPAAEVALHPEPVVIPAALAGVAIAVDAGHGAPGNPGATSATCREEQDAVLPLAEALADAIDAAGLRAVRLRAPGERPTYDARLQEVRESGARLMVSVHGDVRGPGRPWSPREGCEALRRDGGRGFSVLWSDEHADRTVGRRGLAERIARRLIGAGFPTYDGVDYESLYAETAPGVFVDRHRPGRRIRFLRAPEVPSVLVETHHLLDPEEEARFEDPRVRAAFAHAVLGAVVDHLDGG